MSRGATIFTLLFLCACERPVLARFGDKDRFVVFNPLRDKTVETEALAQVRALSATCGADASSSPHCEQVLRLPPQDLAALKLFDRREEAGEVRLHFSVANASVVYPMFGLFVTVRGPGITELRIVR